MNLHKPFPASPSTGAQPSANADGAPALPVISQSSGAQAEAIRALRTHVLAQHIEMEGRRALVVCAPSPKVGCTFTAVNLAISFAQVGMDTLLIDANLRYGPGVARFIRPPGGDGPGLLQLLAGREQTVDDCVQADVMPSLSVMYSGGQSAHAQELLSEERFSEVMGACLRSHQITIVDTPPANSFADARRISTVVGYALIVARKDKSFVSDVKTLVQELRDDHATVVGTVLNQV